MTKTQPSKSSSNPIDANPAADASAAQQSPDEQHSYAPTFAKGCGCLTACVVLAIGVATVGHGQVESWGSGIVGALFLVLIVGSSGLTGWWHKD